jgi:very-short-patch-repair endonuclease
MRSAETKSRQYAKRLRADMTKAEVILWTQLKGRNLKGYRFHRQHPVGQYIVDFACRSQMLIIEVDGATHSTNAEIAHDRHRTKFLQVEGWRVLRVGNLDIYENLAGVLEAIASKLPPPPLTGTSPASGGGQAIPSIGELPHE